MAFDIFDMNTWSGGKDKNEIAADEKAATQKKQDDQRAASTAERTANKAAAQKEYDARPQYAPGGVAMQKAAEDSYGANAGEALQKAGTAGAQFADRAAGQAGSQATGFARASGLSPAQAALMAGQGAESAYGAGMNTGVQAYGNMAQNMGQLGIEQGGQALQKFGIDTSAASQKYGTDTGSDTSKYSTDIGSTTSQYGTDVGSANDKLAQKTAQQDKYIDFFGSLLSSPSDKNVKTDIKDGYGILDAVTKQVSPKSFKYKPGVGMDTQAPRVGVMAQDLEKTPLKSVVQKDENGVKRVDTGQLALGNTAMISELSKKLDTLDKFLKGQKNV